MVRCTYFNRTYKRENTLKWALIVAALSLLITIGFNYPFIITKKFVFKIIVLKVKV